MFLNTKLETSSKSIKVAFIGCGKFVSMFLAQYNQLQKIVIDTIVDINIDNAKNNCFKSGLKFETIEKINFVNSLEEAIDRDIEIFIEATGHTKNYNADVAAYAKKDSKIGEKLDGEGGFCTRRKLVTSKKSKQENILPFGLTDGAIVKRNIKKDESIKLSDVDLKLTDDIIKARQYQYDLIS